MNISNSYAGKVTFEERQRNLNFLKALYTLWAIQLAIIVAFASFAHAYYDELGIHILTYWQVAIATGIILLVTN